MVYSHNEWDPLKEVILGTARGMYWPIADGVKWEILPSGQKMPSHIIEQTEQGLTEYSNKMKTYGVNVLRPKTRNYETVNGFGAYSTRDTVLIIGNKVIYTPTRFTYRREEWPALKHHFKLGEIIHAPLDDPDLYFDAANIIRCNRDILYLVSGTGSLKGGLWLQETLGKEYNVHILKGLYQGSHLDSTLVPIKEGVILINKARCSEEHLPEFLKKWECVWIEPDEIRDISNDYNIASKWVGMNILTIEPGVIVLDQDQTKLIKKFRDMNYTVETVSLPYARYLLGGPHCTTLDTVRINR